MDLLTGCVCGKVAEDDPKSSCFCSVVDVCVEFEGGLFLGASWVVESLLGEVNDVCVGVSRLIKVVWMLKICLMPLSCDVLIISPVLR